MKPAILPARLERLQGGGAWGGVHHPLALKDTYDNPYFAPRN
ncbi:hypothetical protein [uncultured Meiothermus sp.]|jgi:hypothetical protein|nr:hypothetical protein [uncultured Meiothermus sp.]